MNGQLLVPDCSEQADYTLNYKFQLESILEVSTVLQHANQDVYCAAFRIKYLHCDYRIVPETCEEPYRLRKLDDVTLHHVICKL